MNNYKSDILGDRNFLNKNVIKYPAIIILMLGAFIFRCLRYHQVMGTKDVYFFGTDPFYHMRRIFLTLADYPHVPIFDYYVNFPGGNSIIWPASFDFLLATIALILGQDASATLAVEKICAISIPVFGTLTVGIFYLLARQYLATAPALLATLLLALSGPHLLISRIGRVDHHVLEVMLPAIAFLAYIHALQADPKSRAWIGGNITAGIFFGLSFTIWTGSVMFLGTFLIYLFFELAGLVYKKKNQRSFIKGAQIVLFTTFLILLPFCLTSPWGRQGQVIYLALSWFHLLIPLYGLIILLVLERLLPVIIQKHLSLLWYFLIISLTGLLLLGLTIFVQPQSLVTLQDAWAFLIGTEIQISDVNESRSLGIQFFSKRYQFLYGSLLWLVPFVWLYGLLRPWWHRANRNPKNMFLFFWFLSTGGLAALQLRFHPAFSLPLCLYWGILLNDIQKLALKIGKRRDKPILYQSITIPVYIFLIMASLHPAITQPHQPRQADFLTVFKDISNITPETAYYWDPQKKPEYGILSHWSFGHFLNYLSHRPNIANPLGQAEWYLKPIRESYRFFLSEDENEAVKRCRQLQARYVLATSISGPFVSFAQYLEKLDPVRLKQSDPQEYLKKYYTCVMNNRLLLSDGTSDGLGEACASLAPLKQFRLVYESEYSVTDRFTKKEVNFHKLFEVVKGARLTGRAEAGSDITLKLTIKTNLGRSFIYVQRIQADNQGHFETIVPYSTKPTNYPCGPESPLHIFSTKKTIKVEIKEKDVLEGNTIFVDLR